MYYVVMSTHHFVGLKYYVVMSTQLEIDLYLTLASSCTQENPFLIYSFIVDYLSDN